MNLTLFSKPTSTYAKPASSAPHRAAAHPLVTGFRRLSCRRSDRLVLAGELTYVAGAAQGSVRVSMTWEAYSRILDVMRREDVLLPEEVVISTVLQRWGRHQLEASLAEGRPAPLDGYLLDFEGGPLSTAPRAVLQACLLVDPGAGEGSIDTRGGPGGPQTWGTGSRGLLPRKLQPSWL